MSWEECSKARAVALRALRPICVWCRGWLGPRPADLPVGELWRCCQAPECQAREREHEAWLAAGAPRREPEPQPAAPVAAEPAAQLQLVPKPEPKPEPKPRAPRRAAALLRGQAKPEPERMPFKD